VWEKCVLLTGKGKLNTVLTSPFLDGLNYVDIAASYRLIIMKACVCFKLTS